MGLSQLCSYGGLYETQSIHLHPRPAGRTRPCRNLRRLLPPSDNVVYAADPTFDNDTNSRSVLENTPPGVNIGDPISATDADEGTVEFGHTLTYKLGGTDAASFDIDNSTGQLITKAPLNYETENSYLVTVSVDDGETRDNPLTPQTVWITVTDVDEPPAAPVAPTVVSGEDQDNGDPG